jgi:hypothetical protein
MVNVLVNNRNNIVQIVNVSIVKTYKILLHVIRKPIERVIMVVIASNPRVVLDIVDVETNVVLIVNVLVLVVNNKLLHQ